MNKDRHMTAFYLETALMVIIFVLVIAVLAQAFSHAGMQSREAEQLTNAVCLAQNAAEAVSAADSEEALAQLLDENGNVVLADAAVVTAYYDEDMQPVAADAASQDGILRVEATWDPGEEGAGGTFVNSDISVYQEGGEDPLFTMNTGVYLKKASAAPADTVTTAAPAAGTPAEQEGTP